MDTDIADPPRLVAIRGPGGSGKSVFLKRLAWEAATEAGLFCLHTSDASALGPSQLQELCDNCSERLFLFIAGAAANAQIIDHLMRHARKHSLFIIIIVSERHNEWNTHCTQLDAYADHYFDLFGLKNQEIRQLLSLLERHGALGTLTNESPIAREDAFRHAANRQLLVALHEATQGKPFEEIVVDEYRGIPAAQPRACTSRYAH